MLDQIRELYDRVQAARERRAAVRLFSALSDQVLWDIGIERSDIQALFDNRPGILSRRAGSVAANAEFAPCS